MAFRTQWNGQTLCFVVKNGFVLNTLLGHKMIRTPKTKKRYISTLVILFIVQSICSLLHTGFVIQSIARPNSVPEPSLIESLQIVDEIIVQLLFLTILIVLLAPSVIHHTGNVSLTAWQNARPLRSIIWSVIFVSLASIIIFDAANIYMSAQLSIANLIGGIAIASIFLLARAEVVSSSNKTFKPMSKTDVV